MNTHADKTKENKSQSVSNDESQMQSGGESTFQFIHNRPEVVAQRKIQEMANSSPRAMQLRAFQDMANNSPQAKRTAQLQAMSDNHSTKQQPIQKKENQTGLPDNLKTGMENLSGMSLDDVKVHRNSDKPAQVQAYAYAQGTDIHLGPGQEQHLPHELGHVVQQKEGRVKPTKQLKGETNINDDTSLEKEADLLGTKALQLKDHDTIQTKLSSTNTTTVQRNGKKGSIVDDKHKGEKLTPFIPQDKEATTQEEMVAEFQDDIALDKLKASRDDELNLLREEKGKVKESAEKGGMLDKHIGTKGKLNEILKGEGSKGQGDAEQSLQSVAESISGEESTNEDVSDSLMKLGSFARFENVSGKSVLASDDVSGLSESDKWALLVTNSEFMTHIQKGMKLNKIIPDDAVGSIVALGTMSAQFGDSMGGSVAHETNYAGITGSEAVANFGLDYGGYKKDDGKELINEQGWGLSPYVKHLYTEKVGDGDNPKFKEKLANVENVFYVNLELPDESLEHVKVPVHGSLRLWAYKKRAECAMAISSMDKNNPDKKLLENKTPILDRFIKHSGFSSSMEVSTKEDGTKNEDNPLTNLGMTKPSARLINQFSTINQEYHLNGHRIPIPEGSGLHLKDSTGEDKLVARFISDEDGNLKWDNINDVLIGQAIQENNDFRNS
jgi:hypothetical protein